MIAGADRQSLSNVEQSHGFATRKRCTADLYAVNERHLKHGNSFSVGDSLQIGINVYIGFGCYRDVIRCIAF